MRQRVVGVCVIAVAVLWWSCGSNTPTSPASVATSASTSAPATSTSSPSSPSTPSTPTTPSPPPVAAAPVVFVGAGDIAQCGVDGARQTAALLDVIDGIVFTAGDDAYPNGTAQNFAD